MTLLTCLIKWRRARKISTSFAGVQKDDVFRIFITIKALPWGIPHKL